MARRQVQLHTKTCTNGHVRQSADKDHHPASPALCFCGAERTMTCPPGCTGVDVDSLVRSGRMTCPRCGEDVATTRNTGIPRYHRCPHGRTCQPKQADVGYWK